MPRQNLNKNLTGHYRTADPLPNSRPIPLYRRLVLYHRVELYRRLVRYRRPELQFFAKIGISAMRFVEKRANFGTGANDFAGFRELCIPSVQKSGKNWTDSYRG